MDNQNEKQVQESSNTESAVNETPVEQSSSTEPVVEENAAPAIEEQAAQPEAAPAENSAEKTSSVGQFFGKVKDGIVKFFGKVKDGVVRLCGKIKDGICSLSKTQKTVILAVTITIAAALLVFGIFKICQNNAGGEYETDIQNTVTYNGAKYRKKNLVNFLVMGIDKNTEALSGSGYKNDGRADFLALVSIDVFNKSYTVLHLNRDTMTEINAYGVDGSLIGPETAQLALAHTYGDGGTKSCGYTQDAVSKLLNGIRIDYYLALNMPAVGILSEEVGGVPVTFDKDYTDIDPTYTSGATVTLNGQQALDFVRARQGVENGLNDARMARQQLYVEAFISQLVKTSADDSNFLASAFQSVTDYTVTNCSLNTCSRLFGYMSDYECKGNRGLEGTQSVNAENVAEFRVDGDKKDALIMEWFYNKVTE